MKVVITGGAGFIGHNLVRLLASAGGYQIIVVDDFSAGQVHPLLPSGVKVVASKFSDMAAIENALRDAGAIVHLAALPGVIDSIENPQPSFDVNVADTFALLNATRAAGVEKFILASTGGAILGNVEPPILETMAATPLSPYGATKLAGEAYCSAFAGAYGMSCAALRFSNIYGPFSAHKKSVVAAFIKAALRGEPVVVFGDGTQERDYLFVDDLVQGIKTAIDHRISGVYQLGSGRPTSVLELIERLERAASRKITVNFAEERRGEVNRTWCDISKARRELDFSVPTPLDSGLYTTWRWFEDNREFWPAGAILSSAD